MKNITLHKFLSIIIMLFIQSNEILAQCHIDDYQALQSLYNSTNGDIWYANEGWQLISTSSPPANCNLSNMFGVETSSANGRVVELYLSVNNLDGQLPSEIGKLSALKELYLSYNLLSGSIPVEISDINGLEILSLSHCQFYGNVPIQLGKFTNLHTLYLNDNQFSGTISCQLEGLQSIEWLFLQNNFIGGSIPPEFANLTMLNRIFLSGNMMGGCYPLEVLPLCNQLTFGIIDEGNNFDAAWDDFCNSNGDNGGCSAPVQVENVWPGDVNYDGVVDLNDSSIFGSALIPSGPARLPQHQNISWYGHPASNWGDISQLYSCLDLKHFDCDGNGNINRQDMNAVLANMGRSHTEAPSINLLQALAFSDTADFKVLLLPVNDINNDDDTLLLDVALESRSPHKQLNVNGGYFRIKYASEVEDASMVFYNNTWLSPNDTLLFTYSNNIPQSNEIEISFTRLDGVNRVGKGVIGQLRLAIDYNQLRTNQDTIEVNVYDMRVHDINLNQLPVSNHAVTIDFGLTECQPAWNISANTPFQNLYKSSGELTTNGFLIVGEGQQVTYQGEERVRLNTNFSVKAGATFRASTENCM